MENFSGLLFTVCVILNHVVKKLITYAWKDSENCLFETKIYLINMERGYFRIDLLFKLHKDLKEEDMN